ncbi:unnamed protein product [Chrysoparadoxa australica]
MDCLSGLESPDARMWDELTDPSPSSGTPPAKRRAFSTRHSKTKRLKSPSSVHDLDMDMLEIIKDIGAWHNESSAAAGIPHSTPNKQGSNYLATRGDTAGSPSGYVWPGSPLTPCGISVTSNSHALISPGCFPLNNSAHGANPKQEEQIQKMIQLHQQQRKSSGVSCSSPTFRSKLATPAPVTQSPDIRSSEVAPEVSAPQLQKAKDANAQARRDLAFDACMPGEDGSSAMATALKVLSRQALVVSPNSAAGDAMMSFSEQPLDKATGQAPIHTIFNPALAEGSGSQQANAEMNFISPSALVERVPSPQENLSLQSSAASSAAKQVAGGTSQRNRSRYRCSKCGQFKVKHSCPYKGRPRIRTHGSQVHLHYTAGAAVAESGASSSSASGAQGYCGNRPAPLDIVERVISVRRENAFVPSVACGPGSSPCSPGSLRGDGPSFVLIPRKYAAAVKHDPECIAQEVARTKAKKEKRKVSRSRSMKEHETSSPLIKANAKATPGAASAAEAPQHPQYSLATSQPMAQAATATALAQGAWLPPSSAAASHHKQLGFSVSAPAPALAPLTPQQSQDHSVQLQGHQHTPSYTDVESAPMMEGAPFPLVEMARQPQLKDALARAQAIPWNDMCRSCHSQLAIQGLHHHGGTPPFEAGAMADPGPGRSLCDNDYRVLSNIEAYMEPMPELTGWSKGRMVDLF